MKVLFILLLACLCVSGCQENTPSEYVNPGPINIPDAPKPDRGWSSLTLPPCIERFEASGINFVLLGDSGLADESVSNESMKSIIQNLEAFQGKILVLQGRLRTVSPASYTQFDQNMGVLHVALDLNAADFERILNLVSPTSNLAKSTGDKSFYDPSNQQLSLATSGAELHRVGDVIDAFSRHLSLTTVLNIPIEFERVTILDENYSNLIQRIEINRKRIERLSKLSAIVKLIRISERTSYLDGILSLSKTDGDRELEEMLALLERQTTRTQ